MNYFKNLTLKTKLIGLCILLSCVSIVISAISNRGLHTVELKYNQIVDGSMPKLNTLNNMYLSYRDIRINLRTLGLSGLTPEQANLAMQLTISSIDDYEKFNKIYSDTQFLAGEKELYDAVNSDWNHFKGVGVKALELYKSGKPEDFQKLLIIYFEDCPKAAKAFTDSINKLKEFNSSNSSHFTEAAKESAKVTNQTILTFAFVGISFGLFFGFIIANTLTIAVSSIVKNLTENSKQVMSSSNEIAQASDSLAQATTEQAASLEQTAASLEELTAMVGKNTENSKKTAISSEESEQKANLGKEAVERMLLSIEEIDQSNQAIMVQVNTSNEQMTEIVNVIQNIGEKTKVINDIVFQTKLLSFNASVEAARAGEHGKGFAVVAEEVGNLAQMSGNAAREITEMLDSSISKVQYIVQDTKSQVESLIAQGKEKVETGVQVAQQCNEVLNEIVQNVSGVTTMASEISSASQEQSTGIGEINKAVAQLDAVTQQNSATSQQAATAAESLARQAEMLNNAISNLASVVYGGNAAPITSNVVPLKKEKTNLEKIKNFKTS